MDPQIVLQGCGRCWLSVAHTIKTVRLFWANCRWGPRLGACILTRRLPRGGHTACVVETACAHKGRSDGTPKITADY